MLGFPILFRMFLVNMLLVNINQLLLIFLQLQM